MKELYKSITPEEYLIRCYDAMLHNKPADKLYYELYDGTFYEVNKIGICNDEDGIPTLKISVCWSDIYGNCGGIFETYVPRNDNCLYIKSIGDDLK